MKRFVFLLFSVLWCPLSIGPSLFADEYYVQPLGELQFVDGQLSDADVGEGRDWRAWRRGALARPYAVIEGEGEAYVTPMIRGLRLAGQRVQEGNQLPTRPHLAIRTPIARPISGRLYLPKEDFSGMVALKFVIPVDPTDADQETRARRKKEFLEAKLQTYDDLRRQGIPGTAWFRHQVRTVRNELGLPQEPASERRPTFRSRGDSLEATFGLISGGRAVSENLQLDRELPTAEVAEPTVAVDSIEGITVREFEWESLVKDLQPELDRLSKLIPEDQHALFLPSFKALVDLADNAGQQGAPVLQAAEPRAEEALVRARYERQLGLALNQVARLIGPSVIDSVAITGADPYLRTGADVAVLFLAKEVTTLRGFMEAQIAISAGTNAEAKPLSGAIDGIAFAGFRSPDRSVCSYIATLGETVVVTNSPAQLRRLVSVFRGETPALASLDEYTFFRSRYPLGEEQETGLLFLSDKTIRRWCGPEWRIASSRRVQAAAVMAEMQMTHLDQLVEGTVEAGPIYAPFVLPNAGEFRLASSGVSSSTYGTLAFLTPIIELDVSQVTRNEANLYQRWRTGYLRNWSTFFDPIAVRFQASPEKLGIDMTVMPLIDFSDYRSLVAISQGAKIGEQSGDPHAESIFHAAFALNLDAPLVQQGASMATMMIRGNPLSWIGETIALYVDQDSYWDEVSKLKDASEIQKYFEQNAHRFPIGASIEVRSGLKLVAFLAAVRAFIDQSAPGMTVWETAEHESQPYVKVSPSELAKSGNPWDQAALYYAASGDALLISLREDLLHRAIDRQLARREAQSTGKPIPRPGMPWLGDNLCVTVDGGLIELLQQSIGPQYQQQMQLLAWGNLPILNEWHRRFAERDPVAVHELLWHRRLVCPGGGAYRWNEQWQTMESSIYGHPGEPRQGTSLPVTLQSVSAANFGLTFEEHGLRARVEFKQKPATK